MGKLVGPPIDEGTKKFLLAQHIFFVSTAALSRHNTVNVSPKSADEFVVLDDMDGARCRVGYVDYMGSGCETAAHIKENQRITLMFVALTGKPQIVRIYGKGHVIPSSELGKHPDIVAQFPSGLKGTRSLIIVDVFRVTNSCGYSIPKFDYVSERKTLHEVIDKLSDKEIVDYCVLKNTVSIDGIESVGLDVSERSPGEVVVNRVDGYYMTDPREGASTPRKWVEAIKFKLWTRYSSGINGWQRDCTMLAVGCAATAVVMGQLARVR